MGICRLNYWLIKTWLVCVVFSEGKQCLLSARLGPLIRQHCYGYSLTDSCPYVAHKPVRVATGVQGQSPF